MLTATGSSSKSKQSKSKGSNRDREVEAGEENRKRRPFRYYIHDEALVFRIELVGSFTSNDLKELRGCWHTAKPIVGERRIFIDVRRLLASDSESGEWLSEMKSQGAFFLTNHGVADTPEVQTPKEPSGDRRPSWLQSVRNSFRAG